MLYYKVKVKLNRDFIEIDGDQIEIGITSKPEKGRANLEIIKRIAKYLDIPSSSIKIVSGFSSKNKVIKVL